MTNTRPTQFRIIEYSRCKCDGLVLKGTITTAQDAYGERQREREREREITPTINKIVISQNYGPLVRAAET